MDERIVRILALTGEFSSPSTRLRIIYMSKYLQKYDINIKYYRKPSSVKKLIKILKNEKYDIIWLQKRFLNLLNFMIFYSLKFPIIFDFDDNLLVRMKPKKGSYKSFSREMKFKMIKKVSSGFTCGNSFLNYLVKDTKKPSFIYPTPVPINVPQKKTIKINNPIKIGWIGLSGGFMYLDKIMPQLKKLFEEINFKLVIISNKDYPVKYNFIENKRWSLQSQEKEIAEFDFGIMPLNTNSPYDKGKCSYKLLQYMAAGVIPIGEAYGTNLEVIEDGVNGFLIYNNNWYEGLKRVIGDVKFKRIDYFKISKKAVETVKNRYSFESLAPQLASFFRSFKN